MLRMYQQRHGINKVRSILMGSSPTRQSLSLSSSKQPQHHAKESLITKRRRLLSVQTSTGKSSCNNNNVTMVGNQQLKHLRKISSTRTTSRPMAEGNLQRVQHSSSSSSSSSSTGSTSVLDSVRNFSVANFWSPRTKQAAIMFLPIIGNVSYVAISSGFLMTDMLQLRLMLIGGYTGLVGFHSLHQKPLMIPLRWSAVFVALNALGAALLVMDRFAPTLNDVPGFEEDGEALYAQHFSSYLTRGQFHQLLALAERERVPPGTVLTRENLPSDSLYFLVKGKAHVYHGTLRRTPTNMVRRLPRTRSGHGHRVTNDDDYGEEVEMTLTPTPTTNIATMLPSNGVVTAAWMLRMPTAPPLWVRTGRSLPQETMIATSWYGM